VRTGDMWRPLRGDCARMLTLEHDAVSPVCRVRSILFSARIGPEPPRRYTRAGVDYLGSDR
jgi:hypothetical protein